MKSTQELKDFRKLSHKELEAKINELRASLAETKYDFASGLVKNSQSMKITKRNIARALTVLKEAKLVKLAETSKEGEK